MPEVVLSENKSVQQLVEIAGQCIDRRENLFFTRISGEKAKAMQAKFSAYIHYHVNSNTLFIGEQSLNVATSALNQADNHGIAIVAAGTSDAPVVSEIEQTLQYLGFQSTRYMDVGVAGLWRLTELSAELSTYRVLIAVAGMEGALFSVLAGLVSAPVIAVPTSVGYGVGVGGHVALNSALCSCAPGLAVVNIDNGFGAAALAVKMLNIRSSS